MLGSCLAYEDNAVCRLSKAETIHFVFCSKYEHLDALSNFPDNKSDDNLNVSNLQTYWKEDLLTND